MTLTEAINATTARNPYIIREKWIYPTSEPNAGVHVLPTASPAGCLLLETDGRTTHWTPTREDLLAEDWDTTTYLRDMR